MFFGTSAMAFSDGDVIEGVTLDTSDLSSSKISYLADCNYYVKLDNGKIYFGQKPFTVHLEFSRIYWDSSETTRLYVNSSGNSFYTFTSTYISVTPSSITASNHDIYDENGSRFFPLPPVQVVVPEGITAVRIIPQAIVQNLAELIPLGLVVLAILLGVRLLPHLVGYFL